jgi:hypothetical protein
MARRISSRREQQVYMIGHQHIGVDGAAAIASRLFEPMEVALIVLLGKEAWLAVDAALNDVQRVVGKQNAGATWHVSYSEIKCL